MSTQNKMAKTNFDDSPKEDIEFVKSLYVLNIILILILAFPLSKLKLSQHVVAIMYGMIIGVIFLQMYSSYLLEEIYWSSEVILFLYHPIAIAKIAYNMDTFIFLKTFNQILIISTLGTMSFVVIIGFILSLLSRMKGHNDLTLILSGITLAVIDAPELWQDLNKVKNLQIIMEGECIFSTALCLITAQVCIGVHGGYINEWYHYCTMYIRYLSLSSVVGFSAGRVAGYLFSHSFNDIYNLITIVIGFSYGSYIICEEFVYCSGPIACFIIIFHVNQERCRIGNDIDTRIQRFIRTIHSSAELVIYVILSMTSVLIVYKEFHIMYLAVAGGLYVVTNVLRVGILLALSPLLSRIGYGFSMATMFCLFWGSTKGAMQMLITTIMYDIRGDETHSMLTYLSLNYILLTMLINMNSLKFFMLKLRLIEPSTTRKNNINNCLNYIERKGHRLSSRLKMNRYYCDANWTLINRATKISKVYQADAEEGNGIIGAETICPSCLKAVTIEPSPKELFEMYKEVRMRILKACRVSISRQHDKGLLPKEELRILLMAIESAMSSQELVIKIDDLLQMFKKKDWTQKAKAFFIRLQFDDAERVPTRQFRRKCYFLVRAMWFEIIEYVVICLLSILVIARSSFFQYSGFDVALAQWLWYFYFIFVMIVNVNAVSSNKTLKYGFKQYFKGTWNCLDFALLCISTVIAFSFFVSIFDRTRPSYNTARILLYLELLRLFKLFRIFKYFLKRIIASCDVRTDGRVKYAYIIGKAMVIAFEDVLELMPQISDNDKIRDNMKKHINEDKLIITKELALIGKERPWVTVNINTYQATAAVLKDVSKSIYELKSTGYVEDYECLKLQVMLDELWQNVASMKPMLAQSAKSLFFDIPWLYSDKVADFLYENVTTKIWDAGATIVDSGDVIEGIVLVINGLFKMVYIPMEDYLSKLEQFGVMPIKDLICNQRFTDAQEEYFMIGNLIGELGTITERPYSCRVVSDTPCRAYVIQTEVLKAACDMDRDPVNGLNARIWNKIMFNLAKQLLQSSPIHNTISLDQLNLVLDRGFVPNLKIFRVFVVSELIEDILLLDGLIFDHSTNEQITAPCYVPRIVQKIILPDFNADPDYVIPKLMIIPVKGVDQYALMQVQEQISELIDNPPNYLLLENYGKKFKKMRRSAQVKRNQNDNQSKKNSFSRQRVRKSLTSKDNISRSSSI